MKKLLTLLTTISLIPSASSALISCGNDSSSASAVESQVIHVQKYDLNQVTTILNDNPINLDELHILVSPTSSGSYLASLVTEYIYAIFGNAHHEELISFLDIEIASTTLVANGTSKITIKLTQNNIPDLSNSLYFDLTLFGVKDFDEPPSWIPIIEKLQEDGIDGSKLPLGMATQALDFQDAINKTLNEWYGKNYVVAIATTLEGKFKLSFDGKSEVELPLLDPVSGELIQGGVVTVPVKNFGKAIPQTDLDYFFNDVLHNQLDMYSFLWGIDFQNVEDEIIAALNELTQQLSSYFYQYDFIIDYQDFKQKDNDKTIATLTVLLTDNFNPNPNSNGETVYEYPITIINMTGADYQEGSETA